MPSDRPLRASCAPISSYSRLRVRVVSASGPLTARASSASRCAGQVRPGAGVPESVRTSSVRNSHQPGAIWRHFSSCLVAHAQHHGQRKSII